jgi:uncharacterized RDD family membrane protein YckC
MPGKIYNTDDATLTYPRAKKARRKGAAFLRFLFVNLIIALILAVVGYLLCETASPSDRFVVVVSLALTYLIILGRSAYNEFSHWWDGLGTNGDY